MILRHTLNRIFAINAAGRLTAEILFPLAGRNFVRLTHTFVDESLRNEGVAEQLMREAVDQIRRDGLKVFPACSYAVRWFGQHPEESDLLSCPPSEDYPSLRRF